MTTRVGPVGSGAAAFAGGLVFGVGLVVAGMTDPAKVLGFLDVAGAWDPSLALVMVGAIGVHAILSRVVKRRRAPLLDARVHPPRSRTVDERLVVGAALFGVGWGLAGYCPGPGLVSLAGARTGALAFVGAMLAGVALERMLFRREAPDLADDLVATGAGATSPSDG